MNRKEKRPSGPGRPDGVLKGSFTVEMSLLMPIILFLFMGCVLATFYFHDKNILAGAAYETAVVGSTKMREKDGVTEAELERLCRDRIRKKCIFMTGSQVSVDISDEEIQVRVTAHKNRFSVSVLKKAAVTCPEKKIRDADRLEKGAKFLEGKIEDILKGLGEDTTGDGETGTESGEQVNGESDHD